MKQQTVSKIYAQALLQLGEEKKVKVVDELIALTEMINKTNSLENVLFLDVFTQEEKKSVFADLGIMHCVIEFYIETLSNESRYCHG